MSDEAGDPQADEAAKGRKAPLTRISPRLSLFLVGGVALGGLSCMCALIAVLAVWRAG